MKTKILSTASLLTLASVSWAGGGPPPPPEGNNSDRAAIQCGGGSAEYTPGQYFHVLSLTGPGTKNANPATYAGPGRAVGEVINDSCDINGSSIPPGQQPG